MGARGRSTPRLLAAAALVLAAGGPGAGDSPIRETGETFRTPVHGEPWRAVRDDDTGAKWFESARGERADSIEDIVRDEAERLSPIERTLGVELAQAASDPDRAGESADVTIFFRRQPAHEAGMDARARYAPLFAEPLSRARAIAARAAGRRRADGAAGRGLGGAIDEEGALLTDDEKAAMLAARDEVRTLAAAMRRDVADRAKAECAAGQANVAAWLASRQGVTPLGSSWILSTVSARVPLAAVRELADLFPEIGTIARCVGAEATLDVSVPTVSASSWWNAGYNGSSATKVAILDTGVDSGHPALTVSNAGVFLQSARNQGNFADSATSTDDFYGHGTHVAGIAASGDSTYRGVAYGAALMNAKCGYLTTWGGGSLTDPDIYAAADWAADNGASVMNGSFGGGGSTNASSGMSRFFDAAVFDLSIAVAIASGNSGSSSGSVSTPGDAFNVVTAGNFDDAGTTSLSDDSLASSSSRGPTSDGRRKPDISAPGSNVNSCNAAWEGSSPDFVSLSGTSMASPHVAGALALFLDYGASWAPESVKALLLTTARNTSPAPSTPDDNWGWGGLDLAAAYTNRASLHEGSITSSGSRFVLLSAGALASGGRVTLVWNRHVVSNNASAPVTSYSLLDLDLAVYDGSTGGSVGSSASSVNPVEQVKATSAVSSAVVKVRRPGNFPSGFSTDWFAVALESTGTTSSVNPPALACSFVTAPPAALGPGQTFTVAVSVQNTGGIAAFAPVVALGLPSGYSAAGGASTTLAGLAAGASATATFDVTSASGPSGQRTITASASSGSYGESFTSSTLTATHLLDADAPAGSVVVDGGAVYSSSATVALTLSASDAGTGLAGMRIRNAAGTWTEWETFAASRMWVLAGEGVDTVEVEYRDAVANVTRVSDAITYDATPPAGSVIFGDGSPYTTATVTSLTLSATDAVSGVTDQRISTDGTTFGAWEPYGTGHTVTLGSAEGTTLRWAHFRDAAGNVSAAALGTVTRDLTAPTGSVVLAGGAAVTNQRSVIATTSASDALSGVGEMRISTDGVSWTPWIGYASQIGVQLPAPDATNTLYVQYRDRAGNVSSVYSDSIVVDATGPSGTAAIEGGAAFTASSAVTLSLAATDATSGVAAMRLRNEDGAWSAWQAYATSLAWTLTSGEGVRSVHVEFRDGSGNSSDDVSASITVDTTPPAGAVRVEGGAPAVNRTGVVLDVAASDEASGVAEMRSRNEGGDWTPWASAAARLDFTLTAGEGPRTVWVQFRDAVGNVSAEVSDEILLDLTRPRGTLRLDGGRALVLPWEDLVAEPAADDGPGGSGVATVEFSDDAGAAWSAPLADGGSFVLERPAGAVDRTAEVRARWRDAAGNLSEEASASAYLVAAPAQGLDDSKRLLGTIAPGGDVDAYAIELIAGDVLSIKPAARAADRRGDFGVVLDVYDPSHAKAVDGRWPAGARRPGVAKFTAPATGTYVVVVLATGDDSGAGGTYSLATRVARPAGRSRVRGTAEMTRIGASSTASVLFDGADGGYLSGTVRLVVPTAFDLVAPDGRTAAFVLRPRRGVASLGRLPLTGGTGAYELRCATFADVPFSLRLLPPRRTGRADESPPPGQR